jgi:hypothetical protein
LEVGYEIKTEKHAAVEMVLDFFLTPHRSRQLVCAREPSGLCATNRGS